MGRRSERLSKQGMLCQRSRRRWGRHSGGVAGLRCPALLRRARSAARQSRKFPIAAACRDRRVSRLTHTLTRMGQLVYLPRDQKYRIGPSAVAMSTSMMKGLQLRNLIRLRLQDVAEQLPGTVGFVIPDRFHLVYLEIRPRGERARPARDRPAAASRWRARRRAMPTSRRSMPSSRRRPDRRDGTRESGRRQAAEAAHRGQPPCICANAAYCRRLRHCGARISTGSRCRCGRRSTRPIVVVTIGLLSAMYDEKRLHKEVAPRMLDLGAAIGGLLEGADGDIFTNRLERKPLPVPAHNNNKMIKTEDTR